MRTLVQAIGGLTNVVLLLIFGFILFGIFGLDILKGGIEVMLYIVSTSGQIDKSNPY